VSKLPPVLKSFLLGKGLVSLYQVVPAALHCFFLALQLIPIHFVRVVLLAQAAVSLLDLFSVEAAIIVDVKQGVRIPLTGKALILL
jgi:hypothetical protein